MSSTAHLKDPAIPFGSTVLVTGVNGLVGSHVADQLLLAGFNVRGTVRNAQKNSWTPAFFENRYGAASVTFELCEVGDMAVDGSFDQAIKGCSGVLHTTSSINLRCTEPEAASSENIQTVLTCLRSAAAEKNVKRFVLTSSAWAIASPKSYIEFVVNPKDWNDEAIRMLMLWELQLAMVHPSSRQVRLSPRENAGNSSKNVSQDLSSIR